MQQLGDLMQDESQDMRAAFINCDTCFRLWAQRAIAERNRHLLKTQFAAEQLTAAIEAIETHQATHLSRRAAAASGGK